MAISFFHLRDLRRFRNRGVDGAQFGIEHREHRVDFGHATARLDIVGMRGAETALVGKFARTLHRCDATLSAVLISVHFLFGLCYSDQN
jgi:hypothetical protein